MVLKKSKNSKEKMTKAEEKIGKEIDINEKDIENLPKQKMSIRDILKNRMVLALIAVILSVIIVFGTSMIGNILLNEKVEVYSVKKNITKGTQILEDMIVKKDVSKFGIANDVVYDKSEIIGKYAITDLFEGDILRKIRINDKIPYEFEYLSNLNDDEYAYTIKIDESRNALSSRIRSGDVVTIIAIDNESQENKAVIPDELKYIEVMAVINAEMTDVKDKKDINNNNDITSIIVKARGNEQLCRLAEANSKSDISIALVCRDDDEKKEELLYKYISRPQEEQEEQEEHSNIEDERNYNTVIEEDIINDKENDSSMGQ